MDETVEKIKKETDVFSKAKLIRYLLRDKNYRVIDLAKALSITPAYLCHLNRLNKLPDIVVDGYYSKLVNISTLFIISRVKDQKKLIGIYEKILADSLTIKQTEDLIREELYQVKDKGSYIRRKDKDEMVDRIEKKFLGVEAKISQTRTRTKVILEIKGNLEKSSSIANQVVSELTKAED